VNFDNAGAIYIANNETIRQKTEQIDDRLN